jgi:hypothetical protein
MTSMFPTTTNNADLSAALLNSQVNETSGGGNSAYIRFDFESGGYTYGREQIDITGEEFLVNTQTIKHGWVLWSGGRPKKTFASFAHPLPQEPEAIGEDYPSEARGLEGALFDDSTPLVFDTNSYGGRKGVDTLLGQIKAKAATGSAHLYPLVTFDSESYANSKRGGKMTYNPVLTVVSWHDQEGNQERDAAPALEDQGEVEDLPMDPAGPIKRRRKTA